MSENQWYDQIGTSPVQDGVTVEAGLRGRERGLRNGELKISGMGGVAVCSYRRIRDVLLAAVC